LKHGRVANLRIAIIGSGIAGLYAAYKLHKKHDITVFEVNDYPGGHTHTVEASIDGVKTSVDTGFIVYNTRNYPLFTRLLNDLDIVTQEGDMSFSMSCKTSGLEYSGSSLNTLFAQRRNLFSPSFYGMLREIMRFNSLSNELLQAPAEQNLAGFLDQHRFSGTAVDNYLLPMAGAIWSSDPADILDFPAAYFGRFLHNHGLLTVNDRPQWRTIKGGSQNYVGPLIAAFREHVYLTSPIERVERSADHVTIKPRNQETQIFDEVVFACHSDQALSMLSDPTAAEQDILAAIGFQENDTVLHTDTSLLPDARLAWSAWNYHRFKNDGDGVSVTYHMSMLQKLDTTKPLLVSLNATDHIDPDKILQRLSYHHPVYTTKSVLAREKWQDISGQNRTHFCGAYWGYGFHEDGLRSATAVVDTIEGDTVDVKTIMGHTSI